MTPPRRVLKDTSVEITQRTHARTFRFLPRHEINNLVLYVLGVGAQRYGVSLYGFVMMTNHYHLMARDVRGNMPAFVGFVNSLLARALNARQGESDKVWSGSGYASVIPRAPQDLLRKVVYGLSNPANAGLVNRVEDYPGVLITPDQIGKTLTVERPEFFFSPDGSMPPTVTLRFEVPPEFEDLGIEGYRALLWRRVREEEARCREARRQQGRAVLGPRRLLQVARGERPRTREQWFNLQPAIAARRREDRLEAIRELRMFRMAYRAARERWSRGEWGVVFPAGTWWVVRFASAAAAT